MQFTRAGHTQLRGNAILITSTITVVLFSTVVRHLKKLLPVLLLLLKFTSTATNRHHLLRDGWRRKKFLVRAMFLKSLSLLRNNLHKIQIIWRFCKSKELAMAAYQWSSSTLMQVCGLITKPLVRFLMPSSKQLNRSMSSEPGTPKSFTVPLLGSQDSDSELFGGNGQASGAPGDEQPAVRPSSLRMLLTTPTRTVHYYWRKFDDAFMRPVFGGRGFVPYVPGSPTEQSVRQWPAEEAKD